MFRENEKGGDSAYIVISGVAGVVRKTLNYLQKSSEQQEQSKQNWKVLQNTVKSRQCI